MVSIQTVEERANDIGGYLSAPNCDDLDHIPGDYGLPIIGRTYGIMRDINGVLNEHVSRYGRLSRIGFAFQKGLVVTHPMICDASSWTKKKPSPTTWVTKAILADFTTGPF